LKRERTGYSGGKAGIFSLKEQAKEQSWRFCLTPSQKEVAAEREKKKRFKERIRSKMKKNQKSKKKKKRKKKEPWEAGFGRSAPISEGQLWRA